ncbi:hypothetical protein Y032_0058g2927 [Ancylostoma ceylanicum]|uniref:Reverse transcriptase domain-containing protein n=2 Tax=Ancylostoma ceylanicum TaxID=53326 RepID=A0A016U4C2_9BILA|nr:hypothetical protein Y032_0058g2927 [Ancylostoma ceylanicum]
MPPKGDRGVKSKASKTALPSVEASTTSATIMEGNSADIDHDKMSASELIKIVLERNKDPSLELLLLSISKKISTEPTRGTTVLDLVLSNSHIISDVSLLPPLFNSDHNVVEFKVSEEIASPIAFPMPDYMRADYVSLNQYLSGIDWLHVFNHYTSATDVYRRFCAQLYAALSKFVPFKTQRLPGLTYPPHLQSLFAQRQRLFDSLSDPLTDPLYRKVCSDVDHHLKKFLANYERRLASKRNLKSLFGFIRQKTRSHASLPVLTDMSGLHHCSDEGKASALGKYFSQVYTVSSRNVGRTAAHECSRFEHGCSDVYFDPSSVLNLLRKLKPSTTEPFDGIPPIVYNKCASSLFLPLAHIFNISLLLGEVPDAWKHAIVTAIPKIPNASLVSDFRPISITPPPIKVMERIIRDKLSTWLDRFHVVPSEQHGFVSGRSTTTNLIDCIHDWSLALNEGKCVDVIYMDLSKAFDKVSHPKLLNKLESFGIRGRLLSWFESYLDSRHMVVKVGRSFSKSYPCTSGVPQGGALSPLLFLVYTADLASFLNTSINIRVRFYADDIKLYGAYSKDNQTVVQSTLRNSVERMMEWASSWDLPVNLSKCVVLHIGEPAPIVYEVNGVALKTCDVVSDLGVLIDSRLSFSGQVDSVVKKAYGALFKLFRNTHISDPKVMVRLYKAFVLPHLNYCSEVWNPTLKKDRRKLEKFLILSNVVSLLTVTAWLDLVASFFSSHAYSVAFSSGTSSITIPSVVQDMLLTLLIDDLNLVHVESFL